MSDDKKGLIIGHFGSHGGGSGLVVPGASRNGLSGNEKSLIKQMQEQVAKSEHFARLLAARLDAVVSACRVYQQTLELDNLNHELPEVKATNAFIAKIEKALDKANLS